MIAKKTQKKLKTDAAFIGAVLVAVSGFLLPFIVAMCTTLCENTHVFFWQILFSNYAVSVIICLSFSLALIWLSIPAYRFFTQLIKSKGVMPKSDKTSLEAKACASEPEIAA